MSNTTEDLVIISGSQRNKGGMIGPGMTQQTPTILQHNPGLNQPTILQQNPAAQYPTSLPPTSVMPPYQTTQHNTVPQKPTPPPVSQPNQNGIIHLKGGAAVAAQNGTTLPSGEQQQQNLEDEEGKEDIQTESSETESLANTKEKTPMCLINELARYNKISHQYTLDDEQGPAHKKTFYAQHSAAAVALEKTSYTHPPPKPPKNRTTHELELNALAMKRGEQTFYKPLDTRYPHYPQQNYNYRGVYNHRYHYPRMPRVFYVSLKCGQREFIGEGHNRQEARNDAATKALNILKKLPVPNDDPKKSDTQTPETQEPNEKDLLKSEISLVHEIALRRNLNVIFDVIRESGPPHMKSFVTKCRVGEFETEAEGNSKKVSKKKAAELMLDKLKELSPLPPMAQRPKNKQNQNKKKSKNIIKVQNELSTALVTERSEVGELIANIFGSSDEEEEFEGFDEDDIEAANKKKEKKKSTAIVSDDENDEGMATGKDDGQVLPELSDDENEEALRQQARDQEDFVSDFDLMIERKKAEQRKQKEGRKMEGDLINDNDDLIADMICKMKEAAEGDRELNRAKKPAIKKLKFLLSVTSQLRKYVYQHWYHVQMLNMINNRNIIEQMEYVCHPCLLSLIQKKKLQKGKFESKKDDGDEFKIDTKDPRFEALYTSHMYNVDPSAPEYKKTKGMKDIIDAKQIFRKTDNKRKSSQVDENVIKNKTVKVNDDTTQTKDTSLQKLVESVKMKTKHFKNKK
ncbi:STAU [Mytilus edulis]|uniref:STAU n=1 Tax=Mytilus edulis TaxID=6550 RepID=A0A8S3RPX3_MYTED|nr:STAU [Mytilus edulis]